MLLFKLAAHSFVPRLFGLCLVMLLSACGTGSGNRITDNKTLLANQVVVVGKVVLTPGLAPNEQNLGKSYEEWRNVVTLITHHNDVPQDDDQYDRKRIIIVPMDKTFFAQQPAEPFYVMKGLIQMDLEVVFGDRAFRRPAPLRGILKIPLVQGDREVYIGTIRYTRGDFFNMLKVEVIDEYESALSEYQAKFGADKQLEKRLAQVVKAVR